MLAVISSVCQNSCFPSGGTVNNICLTTAPWSQSYLLPLAASSLFFSTSDARGPPSLTFADHPVHLLYKTTEYSLSTAQTPTRAQRCKCAKQPARKIAQPVGAHQQLTAATLWVQPVAQLPAVSTWSHHGLQRCALHCRAHKFCFQVSFASYSETGIQRWNISTTWGLEVSSYFDDFIFLQIVAVQNQVEGEAGLWEILSLTAAKERLRRADKINFLHFPGTENSSSWFGVEASVKASILTGICTPPWMDPMEFLQIFVLLYPERGSWKKLFSDICWYLRQSSICADCSNSHSDTHWHANSEQPISVQQTEIIATTELDLKNLDLYQGRGSSSRKDFSSSLKTNRKSLALPLEKGKPHLCQ